MTVEPAARGEVAGATAGAPAGAAPMPPADWLVVANFALPALAEQGAAREAGGLHLLRPAGSDVELPCGIDLDAMALLPPDVSPLEREGTATTMELGPGRLRLRTSTMTAAPVFLISERRSGRFAVFNDLLLAPCLLRALGLRVLLRRGPLASDWNLTPLCHVLRLGPETLFTAEAGNVDWDLKLRQQPDRLLEPTPPSPATADAAGAQVIEMLGGVIAELAERIPGGEASCMLSGGVDSAAVALLAREAGLSLRPFSVATPWGDELGEAAVTADFLGLDLTPVRFSEQELVAAIADTIRWTGAFEPDLIDGLLAPTALIKHGYAAEVPSLTGYGNDLLNGGLCDPAESPQRAEALIFELVDRARHSNEFSPAQAHAYDRTVFHPYWDLRTIRASLAIGAEQKVREGRRKHHFRLAMSKALPPEVAWRPKIAMHHGNLLAEGLTRRIEHDAGMPGRKAAVYGAIFELLAESVGGEPLHGVEGLDVYERALALVRRRDQGNDKRKGAVG